MEQKFLGEARKEYEELNNEIAVIDSEIEESNKRKSIIAQRKKALDALFAAYETKPDITAKPEPKKTQVINAVAEMLANGKPKHTSELLGLLEGRGIVLGGNNKLTYLATILSGSTLFEADRSIGWTLA